MTRYFDTSSDDFNVPASMQGHSSISYINEAGVPEDVAIEAIRNTDIAGGIDRWMREVSGGGGSGAVSNTGGPQSQLQNSNMFFRSRFQPSTNVYDQMLQCIDAVEFDEVLSNLADVTESMAFNRMSFECIDEDQEDVWNQIAADLDLDSRLREMWRELYKVSQVYVAIEWGQKIYVPRVPAVDVLGPTPPPQVGVLGQADQVTAVGDPEDAAPKKRKRRKQFAIYVPTSVSILDPTKILPVGQLMFGKERFAYLASEMEDAAFEDIFNGKVKDNNVSNLLEGPYMPTPVELAATGAIHGHGSPRRMWLFKPDVLFRHTLTRAQYERFATVRLKSVLPLLDMKAHLRASDRATLIGSTNFIVVIKRGTDKLPARAGEVEQIRDQARTIARMPILVGDHRLSVEIVTPNADHTLEIGRYDVLDERLVMRALGTFRPGGRHAGQSSVADIDLKIVARGLEARRSEIARTLEEKILQATVDKNNGVLTEKPSLVFHPRRVAVSLDADTLNAVLQLRDRGDISRQTTLEELDYDQDTEFLRRRRERDRFDTAFQSSVPFSSPGTNPFATTKPTGPGSGDVPGPDGRSSTKTGRPKGSISPNAETKVDNNSEN